VNNGGVGGQYSLQHKAGEVVAPVAGGVGAYCRHSYGVLLAADQIEGGGALGAYCEFRTISTNNLVKIPDQISDDQAASIMTKGLTAQYLLRRTFPIDSKHKILFHAAAGGVGLIACQWAKALGATVIGTVGSEEKAKLAKTHGCDFVINYNTENFLERVKEITNKEGVDVVYDSIGKDTFMQSLDCLKPLGMMVSFGNASGAVPAFEPSILASKGSLFFTRPSLGAYTSKRSDLEKMAEELFQIIISGKVKVEVNQSYDLENAAQAHRDLESRKTTGSTVLKV
jgi:NADPH2:quinone reductase